MKRSASESAKEKKFDISKFVNNKKVHLITTESHTPNSQNTAKMSGIAKKRKLNDAAVVKKHDKKVKSDKKEKKREETPEHVVDEMEISEGEKEEAHKEEEETKEEEAPKKTFKELVRLLYSIFIALLTLL